MRSARTEFLCFAFLEVVSAMEGEGPYDGAAASSATPAMNAAAIVPRQIAKKNGSVFRNLLRIAFPHPSPHCNGFGKV
ncbi:MAG TPA: hypothetical protein VMF12_04760 [Xanthobacteraceae bacterium]|nr:hypothetical protein [Xanthobacteraceae bacterium]